IGGKSTIVVATAVTTKASSVIPFFPVYCMGLYRIMADNGTHETPIMHQDRIYRDMLYGNNAEYDDKGRLRPDSWELDPEVQKEAETLIHTINEDNFTSDKTGYSIFMKEYLNLAGFDVDGYNEAEVEETTLEDLLALEFYKFKQKKQFACPARTVFFCLRSFIWLLFNIYLRLIKEIY